MLWRVICVVLLIAWILGLFGAYTIGAWLWLFPVAMYMVLLRIVVRNAPHRRK